MNISHIQTVPQITEFLKINFPLIKPDSKANTYHWLRAFLIKIQYRKLKKKEKKFVKNYIKKVTGYSEVQIKRLLKKSRQGKLHWKKWQKGCFSAVYDATDVGLLHEVDKAHKLSGPATREILQREYNKFGKEQYRKLV